MIHMPFPCLNRKTVGGLKLTDLPGVEALQVPGFISLFFILILLTHLDNDPMLNIDRLASNGPFHNLHVFQNTM